MGIVVIAFSPQTSSKSLSTSVFFSDSFHDARRIWKLQRQIVRRSMNDELEGIWKEAVVI
jgi:acetone carboxylase gamma subunit